MHITTHNNDSISAYKTILKQTFNTFALDNIYHLDEARLITQTLTLMAMAILLQDEPDGSTLTVFNILNTLMPGVKQILDFNRSSVPEVNDVDSKFLNAMLHSIHHKDQVYESQIAHYLSQQESAVLIPNLKDKLILKKLLQTTNLLEKLCTKKTEQHISLYPQFLNHLNPNILDKKEPNNLQYNHPINLKYRCIKKNYLLLGTSETPTLFSILSQFIIDMENSLALSVSFKEEHGDARVIFNVFYDLFKEISESIPHAIPSVNNITRNITKLKEIIDTPPNHQAAQLNTTINYLKTAILSSQEKLKQLLPADSLKPILIKEQEKMNQAFLEIKNKLSQPLEKNHKKLFISQSLLVNITPPTEHTLTMLSELSYNEIIAITLNPTTQKRIISDFKKEGKDIVLSSEASLFNTMNFIKLSNLFHSSININLWEAIEHTLKDPYRASDSIIFPKISTIQHPATMDTLMASYFNYLRISQPGYIITGNYYKNFLKIHFDTAQVKMSFLKYMVRHHTHPHTEIDHFIKEESTPVINLFLTESIQSILNVQAIATFGIESRLNTLNAFFAYCTLNKFPLRQSDALLLNKILSVQLKKTVNLSDVTSIRSLIPYLDSQNKSMIFNTFYSTKDKTFSDMAAILNEFQTIPADYHAIKSALFTSLETKENLDKKSNHISVPIRYFMHAFFNLFSSKEKEKAFKLFIVNHLAKNLQHLKNHMVEQQFFDFINSISDDELELMIAAIIQGTEQSLLTKIDKTAYAHIKIIKALNKLKKQSPDREELLNKLIKNYVNTMTKQLEAPFKSIIEVSTLIECLLPEEISTLFNAYRENILVKIKSKNQLTTLLSRLNNNYSEKAWLSDQICANKLNKIFNGKPQLNAILETVEINEKISILSHFTDKEDWHPKSKDTANILSSIDNSSTLMSDSFKDKLISKLTTENFMKDLLKGKHSEVVCQIYKISESLNKIDITLNIKFKEAYSAYLKENEPRDEHLKGLLRSLEKKKQRLITKKNRQGQPRTKKPYQQQTTSLPSVRSDEKESDANLTVDTDVQETAQLLMQFSTHQKTGTAPTSKRPKTSSKL